ncbi:MAG: Clp protease N-terminal domain-containing protein [Acidobacteriota bacterium]
MFDRYTEKARRVIFFARYEAGTLGSTEIGPEHILLGLLREDHHLFNRLSPAGDDLAQIIKSEVEAAIPPAPKGAKGTVDMPLSTSAKRSLLLAAEESERLNYHYIGTEHLMLGLLREGESATSRILNEKGLTIERVVDSMLKVDATPRPVASRIQNDEVAGIIKKLRALIDLLTQRGIISPLDFAEENTTGHKLSINPQTQFSALLDLLVRKGVISENERQRPIDDE